MFNLDFNIFIKNKLKKILRKFGLKIEKLSEIDLELIKISKLNDPFKKIKYYKRLIDKFPHLPSVHLYLIKEMHNIGDIEKFEHFNFYNNKRIQWLNDLGLDELKLDFIWSGMVTGSLGNHYPIESLINAQKLGLKKNSKLSIILPKNIKLRNQSFFNYFNKYINIINDPDSINSLRSLSSLLELPLGLCVPMDNICPSLDAASNITQSLIQDKNTKPLFSLSNQDLENGKNFLKKIGIPKNAWYVTIHARELGYRGENRFNTSDDFRNTNINSYLKAIKYITNNGGYVFRMGDPTMNKITKMENVIDYAHIEQRSEFLDVFLGATSKFCIGSSSGYYHIPLTFSVPVLFTNSPRFEEYYGLRKKDLYLPRMLKYKNSNIKIDIEEFMDVPLGIYNNNYSYKRKNISFIPNSPDEIYNSTKEMNEMIDNGYSNLKKNDKQLQFEKLARSKSRNYFNNNLQPLATVSKFFIDSQL